MKKWQKLAVFLSVLFFCINCSRDDDENSLTAPTTDGTGTLSFLLNGEVWRPIGYVNFPYSAPSHKLFITATEYDSTKNKVDDLLNIEIWGRNYNKSHSIRIMIDSILYEGKYKIKEAFFEQTKTLNGVYNYVDSFSLSNTNFVNITKINRDYKPYVEGEYTWGHYTLDSYVSGTFEITLINKKGDSIVITDGRFDLKNQIYTDY